ncbi:biotin transporter BioY [Fructobacillus sp. M2-14]|uniref:Biotin transporter n=1 Tax=Fructobacillus broussonetiae TaxID=2713173 RepID=A0ABS5R0Y9_9LACO|nr:biotin transporter BioY [Fructobacillus broussonetiae]MBS9338281.1 biotin transporter BioY [Fructobacillus broussonetiae]
MMQHSKVRNLTMDAVFLALLIVFAMVPAIPLGFIPVPIVLQNVGVMLISLLLGARRGTAVMAVFVIMIALGLSVLTGGHGGLAILAGPTAGYIWAWLLQPAGFALLARFVPKTDGAVMPNFFFSFALIFILDFFMVFGLGSAWLAHVAHMDFIKAYLGNMAFVPGDLIKVFLATTVATAIQSRVK